MFACRSFRETLDSRGHEEVCFRFAPARRLDVLLLDGDLKAMAWYIANSEQRTHPVGERAPNGWGLYDMLGNVWELCADWKDSYPSGAVTDPKGPPSGYYRVSRGGGWFDARPAVNATFRSSPEPTYRGSSLGFRLARDASE